MPGFDDIKKLTDEHDEQIDHGLEKAGDAAGAELGHDAQIDKGVDWAQQHTGAGDTQADDEQSGQQS
jgi:MT0933-like antitoxin protein